PYAGVVDRESAIDGCNTTERFAPLCSDNSCDPTGLVIDCAGIRRDRGGLISRFDYGGCSTDRGAPPKWEGRRIDRHRSGGSGDRWDKSPSGHLDHRGVVWGRDQSGDGPRYNSGARYDGIVPPP